MFYGFSEFDIGSMASHIVFREAFCYEIPPKLSPASAAALMCGGATVFNIFDMFDVRPTQRVGVLGLGGLGHLAVQYAAKVGCEVVVFSRNESKRDEAMKYGAHEYVATDGVDSFVDKVRPVHHLIQCASFQVPWELYLPIVYKPGTVYPLTLSFDQISFPYLDWLLGGVRAQASIVAPRAGYRRMLEFSAFHGVEATIQRYPLDKTGIETAMQDLRDGKTRYKAVLYADGES
jgi:D-arabinose 1-dehydrogenase-like Zn-dependent alcohol dehydrogenase